MKHVMVPFFKIVPGMSHSVEDGANRYLQVAGYGSDANGQFFSSPSKKMTGQLTRMDLPHIADTRAQRAGWTATVKVSGVDIPAVATVAGVAAEAPPLALAA